MTVTRVRSPQNWMRALASQYARAREAYPEDTLMVLFDIDGTILDMRHMVCHVLVDYDRAKRTRHFHGLTVEDVTVHENQVEGLLAELGVAAATRDDIMSWYLTQRWSVDAIMASHRPYQGVLDVIRWFQIQPRCVVGLNTGRPEGLREETLRSLNALGEEYRVGFDSDLLSMNAENWEVGVPQTKVVGLRHFQDAGYRIVAVIDNEPSNIEAMIEADEECEILFLHADTIFESQRVATPRTVRGQRYDITSLVSERSLPEHVHFVWHGVNDAANLRQMLTSAVHWGECDVRIDPVGRTVLRHDSFEATPWRRDEECVSLHEAIVLFRRHGKGLKLDLKQGDGMIDRVIDLLDEAAVAEGDIWFNGSLETLREAGFRRLAEALPGAVIQCPVDFLAPLILSVPDRVLAILTMLRGWGINRVSVSWRTQRKRQIFGRLTGWGFEVNIYDVPDLEAFLQAALLLPRSLTSDFNFPTWHYFGRGSGEQGDYHHYELLAAVRETRVAQAD